jgi:hypothetical protein
VAQARCCRPRAYLGRRDGIEASNRVRWNKVADGGREKLGDRRAKAMAGTTAGLPSLLVLVARLLLVLLPGPLLAPALPAGAPAPGGGYGPGMLRGAKGGGKKQPGRLARLSRSSDLLSKCIADDKSKALTRRLSLYSALVQERQGKLALLHAVCEEVCIVRQF